MKININIDSQFTETEITINCNQMNEELEKVIMSLRALEFKLTGIKNNQTYILDASKIFYIDTTDKKPFCTPKRMCMKPPLSCTNWSSSYSQKTFFVLGSPVLLILTIFNHSNQILMADYL